MSLTSWLRYHTTRDKMMSYMLNTENQIGRSLIVPISYATLLLMISHVSQCIYSNINIMSDIYSIVFICTSTILYIFRLYGGGLFRSAILVYCFSFAPFFWIFLIHIFRKQMYVIDGDDDTPECHMMDILTVGVLIPTGYYFVVDIFLITCLLSIGWTGVIDILTGRI